MTKQEKIDKARKLAAEGEFEAADRILNSLKAGREQEESGGWLDYLRTGIQGTTLGHSDEIAGLIGMLQGEDYTQARDAERAKLDQFRAEHPKAAMGAEIVGSLVGGGGLGMLGAGKAANVIYGGAVKNAPTLAGRAASNAVGGMTSGALAGAGYADEGEDVAQGMMEGAGMGMATGAVLGPMVDRMTIGRAQPKATDLDEVTKYAPGLMDDIRHATELGGPLDTTIADLSPQGLLTLKQSLGKMYMSGDEKMIAKADEIVEFYAQRMKKAPEHIQGVLSGEGMPFHADKNPAHFDNFLKKLASTGNKDVKRVANLNRMTLAQKGSTGDVRGMLDELRGQIGEDMFGPHHGTVMQNMDDFTKGTYGNKKAVKAALANVRDKLGSTTDPNDWRVWQEVRSQLNKQQYLKGKDREMVIRNLDKRLNSAAAGSFDSANKAYREISKIQDAYEMGAIAMKGDTSGVQMGKLHKEVDNMSEVEKMSLVYGMGEAMSNKIANKKANPGSIGGLLEPTLAGGEASKAKHDLLKRLVPKEHVGIINKMASLERLQAQTAKELAGVKGLAAMSTQQGRAAQEFFALTTELMQNAATTISGAPQQFWTWSLIGNRMHNLRSMKLRPKDAKLADMLSKTDDAARDLVEEITKTQNKIKHAGEIAENSRARLSKYGVQAGMHEYQWGDDDGILSGS